MTCTTCGATLETTDSACPVCSAPVAPEGRQDAPVGAAALPSGSEGGSSAAGGTASGGTASGGTPPGDPRPAGGGWPPPPTHPSGLSSEVRGWGIAAHLLGLGGALVTVVTLGFLGPLVIWLAKRDEHPFIDHHAKESLNFQLTTLVALVVGALATIPVFLLGFLTLGVLWLVALVVVLAATVVWFVFPILGAVRAANGEGYRYPVSIRFVR